jgi:NADPH:quinone reductase-like Zn-dependent oxidoreductase
MLSLVVQDDLNVSIERREIPSLSEGKALVKMKAAALNRRDQWIREGKYPGIKAGSTLGSDGAGEVTAAGSKTDKHWIGKSVIINPNINWGDNPMVPSRQYHILGMPSDGTLAEYILVDIDRLVEKPAHLSFTQAAALPLGGLTAYRALFNYAEVKPGTNIFISGFGGGVAQFAFLFARACKANLFVSSGNEANLETAESLGAIKGVNYQHEEWVKDVIAHSKGVDLVIDSAGGQQFNLLIKLLKPGGKIVVYGATNGLPEQLDLYNLFWKQCTIQGTSMGNDLEFVQMVDFVSEHKIEPLIGSVRPFTGVIEAMNEMKAGTLFGKSVLTF